jgi:hypothetical protein
VGFQARVFAGGVIWVTGGGATLRYIGAQQEEAMADYRFIRTVTDLFKSRVAIYGPIPADFDADRMPPPQLLDFKFAGGTEASADLVAGSKYLATVNLVGAVGASLKLDGKFTGGQPKEIGTAKIPADTTKPVGATHYSYATTILFKA